MPWQPTPREALTPGHRHRPRLRTATAALVASGWGAAAVALAGHALGYF